MKLVVALLSLLVLSGCSWKGLQLSPITILLPGARVYIYAGQNNMQCHNCKRRIEDTETDEEPEGWTPLKTNE